jgi:hypothetical protein
MNDMTHAEFQRSAINPGDCVVNAWNLVTNRFWLYIGAGLLTLIMMGCVPFVSLILMGPIMGGFYFLVLSDMRGDPVEFGMLFKGFEKFVPLMVVGLIQAIPGIIGQVLRFTVDMSRFAGINNPARSGPGDFLQSAPPDLSALFAGLSMVFIALMLGFGLFALVWTILLQFAIPITLENDIGPIDAIKLSISAASANLGGIIVLLIIEALIGIVGVLALCLGYFVAVPVAWAAGVFAYRQVFPMIENNFNFAPPPPDAYGSSFGSGMGPN